jgi:tetratricopeptide (TPR) repeat protein
MKTSHQNLGHLQRGLRLWLLSAALASITAAAQTRDIAPTSDDVVLEKLGPRLNKSSAASADLIPAVRQAILLARQTADPRYLGQAQSLIGTQWNNPQASHELLTLQATIEQSRHEFANARKTLQTALSKPAASPSQAWLTLATIERVQGNYAAAEKACQSISEPAAQLYARACLLETASLQGQWDAARQGYSQLLREARQPAEQAWLQSLMAENELRAGQKPAALQLFARSLALDADGYTALAFADALLGDQQARSAAQALAVLQEQPDSDAVLIRRAQAYKILKEPRFAATAADLQQRLVASSQRGDNPGHAREQALHALYVQGDAKAALNFAQTNLALQREPIDWLLAVQSAQQAGNSSEKRKLLEAVAKLGLKDARLQ